MKTCKNTHTKTTTTTTNKELKKNEKRHRSRFTLFLKIELIRKKNCIHYFICFPFCLIGDMS